MITVLWMAAWARLSSQQLPMSYRILILKGIFKNTSWRIFHTSYFVKELIIPHCAG
jgi:hypothetical protein